VQSWCIVKELLAASFFAITFSYSLSILRDTFVVRCLKRGEEIENVLIKIGLSVSTGEDAKEKYLKLIKEGI
jgi:hypothetical protein